MEPALGQTYVLYRQQLVGSVLRIVRDPQMAEDLAQEAYLRVHKAAEKGAILNAVAFLFQTARNLAIDHVRRNRVSARFEDRHASDIDIAAVAADEANAEEALIEKERYHQFNEALESLPQRAKEAWRLSQIDGWTYERVAAYLGVSKNTVYNDVKLVTGHCHDVLIRMDAG
ncbi:MAG: sigma-70 family RNA polymerase sigma factor [Parvibaculum sp.]|nr:sigma-70 family RNA polymerase sigma factor [Parvibaculum sp.]